MATAEARRKGSVESVLLRDDHEEDLTEEGARNGMIKTA